MLLQLFCSDNNSNMEEKIYAPTILTVQQ